MQPSEGRNISVDKVGGCGTDYTISIADKSTDPSICNQVEVAFGFQPALHAMRIGDFSPELKRV
jgi:hypothetical protein